MSEKSASMHDGFLVTALAVIVFSLFMVAKYAL